MARPKVSRETANGTKLRPIAGGGGSEPLTRTIVMIHVDQVDVGPNVRVDVAGIDELAASIEAHGVLQPIKVRAAGDRWVIVWGQRRLLAARKAGLERIPAITTADEQTPAELSTEQLVENLHRADLHPMDRARGMREVVDSGISQAELARMLGLGPSTIANDLALLDAPAKVRELLESGEISPAHARAIKGLAPKSQVDLARQVIEAGLSAHRTEEEVQRLKRQADEARERNELEAKDRESQRQQLAASIADFETKKVPEDAVIVVDSGYSYGGDGQHKVLVDLVRAAGYANVRAAKSWNEIVARPAGVCDCTAWKAATHQSYGPYTNGRQTITFRASITKGCIEPKHQRAKEAVADKKRHAGYELQSQVQAHIKATATAWPLVGLATGDIIPLHEARAIAIPRLLAETALWSLLSYRLPTWSEGRGGKRNSAWAVIRALTDDELATEFAKELANDFRDKAGYHVDWTALAAELGLVEAPEPTFAEKKRRGAIIGAAVANGATAAEAEAVGIPGLEPKLKDPVVVAGEKYRIRKLLSPGSAEELPLVEAVMPGKPAIVVAVHEYDKVAGVYRGHVDPVLHPDPTSTAVPT